MCLGLHFDKPRQACVLSSVTVRMEEAATYYTGGLKLHLAEDFRESAQASVEKRLPHFKDR